MKNFTKRNLQRLSFTLLVIFIGVLSNVVQAQNCTVNAGVEATVCENEPLILYGSSSGAFSGGTADINWTQIGGPSVLIINPDSLTTEVIGISGGNSYIFRITTTCLDGSLIYQDVTKYVDPITDSYAGEDFEACSGTFTLNANTPEANEYGYWLYDDPDNTQGVAVNSRTSPTSTITVDGSTCGESRLIWRIYNLDNFCYSTDTIVVTNLGGVEPVNAGTDIFVDSCYSTTQTARLNASYGGCNLGGQVGTWTVLSGPNVPAINDINSNTSSISNLIQGTYVLQWDVSGPCANGSDQVQITVAPPTSDVTDASGTGSTLIFCDGRTEIVLNGTFPEYTNETVEWVQIAGPLGATIVNSTNHVTSVTDLDGSSNYQFRYTITNNVTACNSSAVVSVIYADQPSIDIDLDRIDLMCYETTAFIDYTEGGDGPAAWSIVSGPTTSEYETIPTNFKAIDSTTVKVPGLFESGTYVIRFRKSPTVGSDCETNFDDVQVVVSETGDLSNAGTDQFLACNVDTTALAGNEPLMGIGTWSQVSGPSTATIDDLNFFNSKIRSLVNGAYTFRWIIDDGIFCFSNQDDVEIVVADTTPNAAIAGPDTSVCQGTPVFLSGNEPILNEWGYWSISPQTAGITWGDSTSNSTYVDGLSANQTYEVIWTLENACGVEKDTLLINTNNIQGPVLSDAGPDICLNGGTSSATMAANDPTPGTGQWNFVSGPNSPSISTPSSNTTGITGMVNGTYEFEWAITNNSCVPTTDTVIVTMQTVYNIHTQATILKFVVQQHH
jgi:hypothetical protein